MAFTRRRGTPSVRSNHSSHFTPVSTTTSFLHTESSGQLSTALLDLINLICREHILSWYSISISRDKEIAQYIKTICVHALQTLEVRIADVDFIELTLIDWVNLVEKHYEDWDNAVEKTKTAYGHSKDVGELFHGLQPHLAISLEPSLTPIVDQVYLRKWVDHLLRLLLPVEDYRAETERSIVKEIIVNIILQGVFTKVAEPWFLYKVMGDIIGIVCEGGVEIPKKVEEPVDKSILDTALSMISSLSALILSLCLSISTLYGIATTSAPARHRPNLIAPSLFLSLAVLPPSPVFTQLMHYIQLASDFFTPAINSIVSYSMKQSVFNIGMVETVVGISSKALFPNGHPPPHVPDPNLHEREELRIRCEERVAGIIPCKLFHAAFPPTVPLTCIIRLAYSLRLFFTNTPAEDKPIAIARHLLRPFSSHIANVHLFVLIIDLVIGKIFPELVQKEQDS
jgi:hypothetical protein